MYNLKAGDDVEIKDSSVYNEEFYDLAWTAPVDDPMKPVYACKLSIHLSSGEYR